MLFLSLLPSISNIAWDDARCCMAFGQKCLFLQYSDSEAYLPGINRIKTCNSQYVKSYQLWTNKDRIEPEPNSRDISWGTAMMR